MMEAAKFLLLLGILSLVAKFVNSLEIDTLKNLVVESMESKVIFYLYTRENSVPELLHPNNASSLEKSHFDTEKATKFLIHGYLDNVNRPMSQTLKNKLLETDDVNVIVVDWGKIAINPIYFIVAYETTDVGRHVATLLDFLVQQGCDPKSFHLIGHSLGAHVAGFVGKSVQNGKPGRITGLDVAKPSFEFSGSTKKLAPTDADFVDCIHTSGGLQGFYQPQCQVDFYMNGGTHPQPGCPFFDFGSCSHQRSFYYFAESILTTHKFPALKCNWRLKPVDCSPSDVNMGYYIDNRVQGIFTAVTNSEPPYAPVVSMKQQTD